LRQVENAAEVRDFLERAGFITVRLESLSLLEQVRLFASAEFVVGPHGAGLANLLFTPPSARVIELTPNTEMRPFFWMISSKLGHEYAMLPCETDIPSFNGKLRVDIKKLATLLALLEKA
jgi:capsular polysaccharide biosynthesis protein